MAKTKGSNARGGPAFVVPTHWIRPWRESYPDYSQQNAADALGQELSTYQNWERNRSGIGKGKRDEILSRDSSKDPRLRSFQDQLKAEIEKASADTQRTQGTAEAVASKVSLVETSEPAPRAFAQIWEAIEEAQTLRAEAATFLGTADLSTEEAAQRAFEVATYNASRAKDRLGSARLNRDNQASYVAERQGWLQADRARSVDDPEAALAVRRQEDALRPEIEELRIRNLRLEADAEALAAWEEAKRATGEAFHSHFKGKGAPPLAMTDVLILAPTSQTEDTPLKLCLSRSNGNSNLRGFAAYFSPFTWFAYRPWEAALKGLVWITIEKAETKTYDHADWQANPYFAGFQHARRLVTEKILKSADWRYDRATEDYCAKHNRELPLPSPISASLRRTIRLEALLLEIDSDLAPAPENIFFKLGYVNGLLSTIWAAIKTGQYHSDWGNEQVWFGNLGGNLRPTNDRSQAPNQSPFPAPKSAIECLRLLEVSELDAIERFKGPNEAIAFLLKSSQHEEELGHQSRAQQLNAAAREWFLSLPASRMVLAWLQGMVDLYSEGDGEFALTEDQIAHLEAHFGPPEEVASKLQSPEARQSREWWLKRWRVRLQNPQWIVLSSERLRQQEAFDSAMADLPPRTTFQRRSAQEVNK